MFEGYRDYFSVCVRACASRVFHKVVRPSRGYASIELEMVLSLVHGLLLNDNEFANEVLRLTSTSLPQSWRSRARAVLSLRYQIEGFQYFV